MRECVVAFAALRNSGVTVAEDLSWDQFSALNLNLPFLPGVTPQVGEAHLSKRAMAVVGYVGSKTKQDLQRMGNIVGDTVGRTALSDNMRKRYAPRCAACKLMCMVAPS